MYKLFLNTLFGKFHNQHRPKKPRDEFDIVYGSNKKLKKAEDLQWWLKAKRGIQVPRQIFIA